MFLVILIMLYPFLNQIAISLSDNVSVMSGRVSVYPVGFTIKAYKDVMTDARFIQSFSNTIYFTLICTVFQVAFMALYAYPLSKKYLPGRNFMLLLVVLPMVFSGGIIPTYLVMKDLHLTNTFAILVFAGLFSGFNVVLMKNFMSQVPSSLEEAAKYAMIFDTYYPDEKQTSIVARGNVPGGVWWHASHNRSYDVREFMEDIELFGFVSETEKYREIIQKLSKVAK